MALLLKSVNAAHGLRWISQGLRLFARKPMGFTSLFVLFMAVAMVLSLVPLLGALLQFALLPLLSLGFMVAAQALQQQQPLHPKLLVQALRGDLVKRRGLINLCLIYGVLALGILVLANAVSNDAWSRLQVLLAKGSSTKPQLDALFAESGVLGAGLLAGVLGTALSVPFWHAPALVHFNNQPWPQALFSSSLALWRNRGAFLLYSLGWLLLIGAVAVALGLVLGLLGMAHLMAFLSFPLGLATSAAFYVSLIFCFDDSFQGQDVAAAPADPAADTPAA